MTCLAVWLRTLIPSADPEQPPAINPEKRRVVFLHILPMMNNFQCVFEMLRVLPLLCLPIIKQNRDDYLPIQGTVLPMVVWRVGRGNYLILCGFTCSLLIFLGKKKQKHYSSLNCGLEMLVLLEQALS